MCEGAQLQVRRVLPLSLGLVCELSSKATSDSLIAGLLEQDDFAITGGVRRLLALLTVEGCVLVWYALLNGHAALLAARASRSDLRQEELGR